MTDPTSGAGLAIEAEGLHKSYGKVEALCGVDLAVPEGSVLGLLGPNGAGKTTAVRILTTLLPPDGGSARVAGYDVVREAAAAAGPHRPRRPVRRGRREPHRLREPGDGRAPLPPAAAPTRGRAPASCSSASRWRARPAGWCAPTPAACGGASTWRPLWSPGRPVLFLDEPTTGLDPRSRIALWEIARGPGRGQGTTVLLTTQYLDEADRLADRIAVIDRGTVIAEGTSDELKARVGGEQLEVVLEDRRPGRRGRRGAGADRGRAAERPRRRRRRGPARPARRDRRGRPAAGRRGGRRGRPRAEPAHARRRLPGPHRPRRRARRGRGGRAAGGTGARRERAGLRGLGHGRAGAAQPPAHPAPARPADQLHDPAGHLRAAVRLRLRRRDPDARASSTSTSSSRASSSRPWRSAASSPRSGCRTTFARA